MILTWASSGLTWAVGELVAHQVTTTDPGAPALAATPGIGTVALSRTPPASIGGSAITGYEYRQKTDGDYADDACTEIPDSAGLTSYDVPRPTAGTAYAFQHRAGNATGTGLVSNEDTATPADPAPALEIRTPSQPVCGAAAARLEGLSAARHVKPARSPSPSRWRLLPQVWGMTGLRSVDIPSKAPSRRPVRERLEPVHGPAVIDTTKWRTEQ